jgi:hypothetical protein
VIVTDHGSFDYWAILERAKLIVDTRCVFSFQHIRQFRFVLITTA